MAKCRYGFATGLQKLFPRQESKFVCASFFYITNGDCDVYRLPGKYHEEANMTVKGNVDA